MDIAGTGVQTATLPKVIKSQALRDRADNPVNARLWYTSINPKVKPFDNIDCRKAVMYGMSPLLYQNAYGGKYAGGDIATTLLPPQIPGYQDFDLSARRRTNGQVSKAKAALKSCGQSIDTKIGYRAERPKEKATAEAFQQAMSKVGVKITPKPLPEGDYFSSTCGLPSYNVKNNVGLCVNGWGADWPTATASCSRSPTVASSAPPGVLEHLGQHPRGELDDRQGDRRAGHRQAEPDVG